MKISVVTAVLNRAHTIEHALRGVQAQTYRNLEHVIQDGASTDGTLDVIARLADARARVVSSRDGGIYQAINAGIARASASLVRAVRPMLPITPLENLPHWGILLLAAAGSVTAMLVLTRHLNPIGLSEIIHFAPPWLREPSAHIVLLPPVAPGRAV